MSLNAFCQPERERENGYERKGGVVRYSIKQRERERKDGGSDGEQKQRGRRGRKDEEMDGDVKQEKDQKKIKLE